MSFNRAVIKRFNEIIDTSIPPPGAYDPKFATDVAVKASAKISDIMPVRTSVSQPRQQAEDSELGQSGRASRSRDRSLITIRRSLTYSRSRTRTNEHKSSPSPISKITPRKFRLSRPRSVQNPSRIPKIKSATSGPLVPLKYKVSSSTGNKDNRESDKGPAKNLSQNQKNHHREFIREPTKIMELSCNNYNTVEYQNIIQEIQEMAQKLQVELSEYKRRLSEEEIRGCELNAKRCELEFTIQSLKRELQKYISSTETKQLEEEISCRAKLAEVSSAKVTLEKEIHDLQEERKEMNLSCIKITERVGILEEEKSAWQKEKREYEVALDELKRILKEKEGEGKREVSEKRCFKDILSKSRIDSCYHHRTTATAAAAESTKTTVTDFENRSEVYYEEKVLELTQQKEELEKELNEMRQQLKAEEKTVIEIMRTGRGERYHRQNFAS